MASLSVNVSCSVNCSRSVSIVLMLVVVSLSVLVLVVVFILLVVSVLVLVAVSVLVLPAARYHWVPLPAPPPPCLIWFNWCQRLTYISNSYILTSSIVMNSVTWLIVTLILSNWWHQVHRVCLLYNLPSYGSHRRQQSICIYLFFNVNMYLLTSFLRKMKKIKFGQHSWTFGHLDHHLHTSYFTQCLRWHSHPI